MFEGIGKLFNKLKKAKDDDKTKNAAKERLHLVLMQDRANVSADFLELMKQEIIDVIKKYIDVDEKEIDVRLTNKQNTDGTVGAPALYANIPIVSIKSEARKIGQAETSSPEKEKKVEKKKAKKVEEKLEAKVEEKPLENKVEEPEVVEEEIITEMEAEVEIIETVEEEIENISEENEEMDSIEEDSKQEEKA